MARQFTDKEREFIREVKELCERNYSAGGDTIIECFEDFEIVDQFQTLDDVREYCGLHVERELNSRWGEDSDPELKRSRAFLDADWS